MSFYLFGTPDEALRLKAFSSVSRGGKCTIKIEIETTSPYHMGYALEQLAEVQAGQKVVAQKSAPKPKAPLALPKPEGV